MQIIQAPTSDKLTVICATFVCLTLTSILTILLQSLVQPVIFMLKFSWPLSFFFSFWRLSAHDSVGHSGAHFRICICVSALHLQNWLTLTWLAKLLSTYSNQLMPLLLFWTRLLALLRCLRPWCKMWERSSLHFLFIKVHSLFVECVKRYQYHECSFLFCLSQSWSSTIKMYYFRFDISSQWQYQSSRAGRPLECTTSPLRGIFLSKETGCSHKCTAQRYNWWAISAKYSSPTLN